MAQQLLLLLGIGFLVANLRVGRELIRFWRARRDALLVWRPPRPRLYRLSLLIGVVQALLLASLVLLKRPAPQIFGLGMMLIYFLCATPLSVRIERGFYAAGVWSDRGFVPWSQISGVSWRENPVTLILLSPLRHTASPLQVPSRLYGEARRVLRERIRLHGLHGDHAGLELREHESTEDA